SRPPHRCPPAAPAPQRSYAQTFPSRGSISMPADVPHVRPAGSWPQLRVTFGAGFGSPSPVIGLGGFVSPCANKILEPMAEYSQAAERTTAHAPLTHSRIRGL